MLGDGKLTLISWVKKLSYLVIFYVEMFLLFNYRKKIKYYNKKLKNKNKNNHWIKNKKIID